MGRLTSAVSAARRPEVWAGPECSFLTVGDWACDQLALTGHDERADDIERLAALGVSAVRYPILWGRSRDGTDATDWAWAESRVDALVGAGIRPIVGLVHHGFGPPAMDPLDADWPRRFGAYAGEVAARFPQVDAWLPINEPLTTARFGALYGWWAPYARDDDTFVRLLLAQAEAWLHAARAIRRVNPQATLIVNEDVGRTFGTRECGPAVAHYNERRWLTFDLLTGRIDRSHPLWGYLTARPAHRRRLDLLAAEPEPPGLLGVDHYVTSERYLDHRLDRFPDAIDGSVGASGYVDVELARVSGFAVDGFARSIEDTWRRYGLPIALTEVQLAGEQPDQLAWWAEAWRAAVEARGSGIPVTAVTAWSTFGAYDWSSVLRQPCGAYEPGCYDTSDPSVMATALADLVAATAAGIDPDTGPGWWRGEHRILYESEARGPQARRSHAGARAPRRRAGGAGTTVSQRRPRPPARDGLARAAEQTRAG
jgi:dTDP-4-dehydrorhamnose reductase